MAIQVFDPNDDEAAQEVLDQYAHRLMELGFDGVRIFATSHDLEAGSKLHTRYAGQWYATFGGIAEWLTRQQAKTARQVQREMEEEDEDSE